MTEPETAPSLWRNDSFRRLWTAVTISSFGSFITRMALPLVAILVLGTDALGVALTHQARITGSAAFVARRTSSAQIQNTPTTVFQTLSSWKLKTVSQTRAVALEPASRPDVGCRAKAA